MTFSTILLTIFGILHVLFPCNFSTFEVKATNYKVHWLKKIKALVTSHDSKIMLVKISQMIFRQNGKV